jgi:hypothetical protein
VGLREKNQEFCCVLHASSSRWVLHIQREVRLETVIWSQHRETGEAKAMETNLMAQCKGRRIES